MEKSIDKRRAGRPRLMQGDVVSVNIRMTRQQRERLRALGGARWVRDQIEKSKIAAS